MVLNKLGLQKKETNRKVPYELPKGIFPDESNHDSWLEIVRRLVIENIKNEIFIENGFIELDKSIANSKDPEIINIFNVLKNMNIDSPFCGRKAYLIQLEVDQGNLRMRGDDKNHPDLESCMVYFQVFCNTDYPSNDVLDYLSVIAKEKNKEKLDDSEKKQAMKQFLNDPEKNYPRTPIFIKAPKQIMEQLLNAAKWVIENVKNEEGKQKYIYQKNSISTNDLMIIAIGGSIYKISNYLNCWIDDVLPVLP